MEYSNCFYYQNFPSGIYKEELQMEKQIEDRLQRLTVSLIKKINYVLKNEDKLLQSGIFLFVRDVSDLF